MASDYNTYVKITASTSEINSIFSLFLNYLKGKNGVYLSNICIKCRDGQEVILDSLKDDKLKAFLLEIDSEFDISASGPYRGFWNG